MTNVITGLLRQAAILTHTGPSARMRQWVTTFTAYLAYPDATRMCRLTADRARQDTTAPPAPAIWPSVVVAFLFCLTVLAATITGALMAAGDFHPG
jgi:hypothetical protein